MGSAYGTVVNHTDNDQYVCIIEFFWEALSLAGALEFVRPRERTGAATTASWPRLAVALTYY